MNNNIIDDESELAIDNQEELSLKKTVGIFGKWIKAHKAQIIFAGLSLLGIFIALRKMKSAKDVQKLMRQVKQTVSNKIVESNAQLVDVPSDDIQLVSEVEIIELKREMPPHPVREHTRTLHPGWKPSLTKIHEAEERGIFLEEGQTFVNAYETGIA